MNPRFERQLILRRQYRQFEWIIFRVKNQPYINMKWNRGYNSFVAIRGNRRKRCALLHPIQHRSKLNQWACSLIALKGRFYGDEEIIVDFIWTITDKGIKSEMVEYLRAYDNFLSY